MGGRLAPDPRQVRDSGMGQYQPQPGMARADLDGVASQRGNAAPRVADDRQAVLVGEGEDVLQVSVIQVEALRARMELDSARPVVEGAPRLRERRVVGIEPAERKQPPVA